MVIHIMLNTLSDLRPPTRGSAKSMRWLRSNCVLACPSPLSTQRCRMQSLYLVVVGLTPMFRKTGGLTRSKYLCKFGRIQPLLILLRDWPKTRGHGTADCTLCSTGAENFRRSCLKSHNTTPTGTSSDLRGTRLEALPGPISQGLCRKFLA